MLTYERIAFYLEKMVNGSWIIGTLKGRNDDFGRIHPERSAFEQYADAEKHAIRELKRMMREYRDEA
jgi:hypothetical protein